MKSFEYRSVCRASMAQVLAFHENPRAIKQLTPPPIFIQVNSDTRTSLTNGELDFTLWFALLPVRWVARHQPASTTTSFRDEMVRGPLQSWTHEHRFTIVRDGVELCDQVTYEHRSGGFWGLFTRLFFDGLPLRLLFFYRHLRTRQLAPKQRTLAP